jgi:hypothetical protein
MNRHARRNAITMARRRSPRRFSSEHEILTVDVTRLTRNKRSAGRCDAHRSMTTELRGTANKCLADLIAAQRNAALTTWRNCGNAVILRDPLNRLEIVCC